MVRQSDNKNHSLDRLSPQSLTAAVWKTADHQRRNPLVMGCSFYSRRGILFTFLKANNYQCNIVHSISSIPGAAILALFHSCLDLMIMPEFAVFHGQWRTTAHGLAIHG